MAKPLSGLDGRLALSQALAVQRIELNDRPSLGFMGTLGLQFRQHQAPLAKPASIRRPAGFGLG